MRRTISTLQRRPHGARSAALPFRVDPASFLLVAMLAVLWVAGGASRADVMGQVIARAAAWAALVVTALIGRRPSFAGQRPVVALLGVAILIPLVQLLPLPPAIWQALPGRALFAQAVGEGASQPWRPLSLVPGATENAAGALVVPATILLLLAQLRDDARDRLPGLVLGLIVAATILALLQFSTGGLDNPLINETVGQVSGPFANRNHFALLMAVGCVLAPAWAFLDHHRGTRRLSWRAPVALGLVLLFFLMILGSGSRAGLLLGGAGVCLGLALVQREVRGALAHYPRWVFPTVLGGIIGVVAIFVIFSIAADRAVSIDRILVDDGIQDMRRRALPTVLAMIGEYFPVGSGMGSFDPVFRLHEPFELLKLTFFNHAHNDILEIMTDSGIAGALLLIASFVWWAWISVRVWRAKGRRNAMLPRLGSTILLLVAIASLFDYPARTPLVMAVVVMAATWLSGGANLRVGRAALPKRGEHL